MNHIQKWWWIYLIILIILIIIFYFGFNKSFFDKLFVKRVGDGEEPTENDIYCGGNSKMSQRTDDESCTKPLYGKTENSKERAFIMQTDDYPYDRCMEVVKDKNGKEWTFNYKSNKRCIFIDDTSNPFFEPLTTEEQNIWDSSFKSAISEILLSNNLNCCFSDVGSRRYLIEKKLKEKNESLNSIYWKIDLINEAKNKHNGYLSRQTLQPQIVCWGCNWVYNNL